MTYRIAYLLSQGVPAGNILALTFTNKAAREMKERIQKLVGNDARYLWMGTFHSICAKLLRHDAEKLGFTRDFTIYDTSDSKSVIKAICKERGLDEKIYKPAVVLGRISMAKNNLITPSQYGQNRDLLQADREARLYDITTVYALYEARLKASNAMDFDDLLINMLRLMDQYPDVREQLQLMFRYVLVDEYQDTNYVQYLLVGRLAAPQDNICSLHPRITSVSSAMMRRVYTPSAERTYATSSISVSSTPGRSSSNSSATTARPAISSTPLTPSYIRTSIR